MLNMPKLRLDPVSESNNKVTINLIDYLLFSNYMHFKHNKSEERKKERD